MLLPKFRVQGARPLLGIGVSRLRLLQPPARLGCGGAGGAPSLPGGVEVRGDGWQRLFAIPLCSPLVRIGLHVPRPALHLVLESLHGEVPEVLLEGPIPVRQRPPGLSQGAFRLHGRVQVRDAGALQGVLGSGGVCPSPRGQASEFFQCLLGKAGEIQLNEICLRRQNR